MASFSLYILHSKIDSSTANNVLSELGIDVDALGSDAIEHQILQRGLTQREASRLHQRLLSSGILTVILFEGDFELEPDLPLNLFVANESNVPLIGATVIVKTPNNDLNNNLPTLTTDDNGEVSLKSFSSLVNKSSELPPVWFEVTHEGISQCLLHSAFSSWQNFLSGQDVTYLIQVGPQPSPKGPDKVPEKSLRRVRGKLALGSAEAAAGYRVAAYDRDLRSARLLGETLTNGEGRYYIEYDATADVLEVGAADLLMRVFGEAEAEVRVEVSNRDVPRVRGEQVLFNAGVDEVLDLLIVERPSLSLFETTLAKLVPAQGETSLADLTPDDVAFLGYDTNLSLEDIAFAAEDARLNSQTDLPAGIFFGLGRKGIGVISADVEGNPPPRIDLPTVLDESVDRLMEAIDDALETNLIPVALRERRDAVRTRFETLKQTNYAESPGKQRERVMTLGQIAGLDAGQAERLADHLASNVVIPSIWDDLVEREVVTKEQLGGVKLTLELNTLTANTRLTELLKTGGATDLGSPVRSLRDLVVLDEGSWSAVLEEGEVDPPEGLDRSVYASHLARAVEARYPTDVLAERVVRRDRGNLASRIGSVRPLVENNRILFGDMAARTGVALPDDLDLVSAGNEAEMLRADLRELVDFARTFRYLGVAETLDRTDLEPPEVANEVSRRVGAMDTFFKSNPDLDLRRVDLIGLEKESKATAVSFEGIADDLRPLVREQAMAYQRVQNIVPDAGTAEAFFRSGYDSATAVANAAPVVVAQDTGITLEAAKRYRAASQRVVTETAIIDRLALAEAGASAVFTRATPRLARPDSDLRKIREVLGRSDLLRLPALRFCPQPRRLFCRPHGVRRAARNI